MNTSVKADSRPQFYSAKVSEGAGSLLSGAYGSPLYLTDVVKLREELEVCSG